MEFLKRLTRKNLKLNKRRTIVTIIGIVLSVALITTVADMYMTGVNTLIEVEKNLKGAFHYTIKAVDYDDLSYIENNRQIKDYAYVKSLGFAEIEGEQAAGSKQYINVVNIAKDDFDVLRLKLSSGRMPKAENEVLIAKNYTEDGYDAEVGDTISLNLGKRIDKDGKEICTNTEIEIADEENADDPFGGEKIIDSTKKEYKITGIIETASNLVESYGAAGYTFITVPNSAKVDINEGDKVDTYLYFKKKYLKDAYRSISKILGVKEESFKVYIDDETDGLKGSELDAANEDMQNAKYEILANYYLVNMELNPLKASGVDSIGKFAIIICFIVVVASIFCIKNSFDISVSEKIKQYGMLRSIGATKSQLRFNVLYEAYILGVIGIPLGVLLGLFASYVLSIITNALMPKDWISDGKLIFVVSTPAIIVSVVLAIITILFSSYGSAKKATKISPIESIRNSGKIKIKSKKLKVPFIIRKTCGIGGEISYKNLKRNRSKYRTTIIAMVITIVCFIVLNSIVSWLYRSFNEEIGDSKYNVTGDTTLSENKKKDLMELSRIEGVNEVVTVIGSRVENIDTKRLTKDYREVDNYSDEEIEEYGLNDIYVDCLNHEAFAEYAKKIGMSYDDLEDGVIYYDDTSYTKLNEKTDEFETVDTNKFDFEKGDVIDAKTYYNLPEKETVDNNKDDDNEGNDESYKDIKVKVKAVTEICPDYMKGRNSYRYEPRFIISKEYFNKVFADCGVDYEVNFSIASKDDSTVSENISEFMEKNYKYYNLYDQNESVRNVKNVLLIISIFLYGFIIVVTMIGITSIFNTITTSIRLRAQEFAMLKSVGMTKKEFKRMIRLESVFMGVKSLFYGLILGVAASYAVYHLLGGDREYGKYAFPYSGIAISIIAVIFIISIIMGYAVRKNDKQNIIETIRNENI